MERSEATFEGFDGVRVELPGERVLVCKALTVKEGVHFLRMLSDAEAGDADAQWRFLEEFAERVGVEDEPLSPYEVFELGRRFLRRRTWSPTGPAEAEERASSSSTPGSTI